MIIRAKPSPTFPQPTARQAITEFLLSLEVGADPVEVTQVIGRDGRPSPAPSVVTTMFSVAAVHNIGLSVSQKNGKLTVRRVR